MSLNQFKASPLGALIGPILNSDEAIRRMETKSASGRPAVEAIGKDIEARVGSLDDGQKKLVGRWVKEVLARRGWRPDRKGRVAAGNFFSRGTIYRPAVPQAPSEDGAARPDRQLPAENVPLPPLPVISPNRENYLLLLSCSIFAALLR